MFDGLNFKCGKCGCRIHMLGDDYFCIQCHKIFCFECVDKHGCNVELIPDKYLHQKWKVIEKK